MNKLSRRGVLLFELFIALMILSVGIASTFRIFGEALLGERKDQELAETKLETKKFLFSWFAYPSHRKLPDHGMITVPLSQDSEHPSYWCEVHTENLLWRAGETEQEKQNRSAKPVQYYRARFHVTRPNKVPILDLETVILTLNQSKDQAKPS